MKRYLLVESRTLDDFDTREEAEKQKDILGMLYPESNFEVTEQEFKSCSCGKLLITEDEKSAGVCKECR